MKAINRLDEIQKISKFSRYIDESLIPNFTRNTNQEFQKRYFTDDYTYIYSSLKDPDGELLSTTIRFTTNKEIMGDDEELDDDYKFYCELVMNGRKIGVGGMIMDTVYDTEILLDTYYDYFENIQGKNIKIHNM